VSGEVHRRGDRQVALARSLQLLACEFAFSVDGEQVVRWLEAALAGPRQEFPISRRHRFEVVREAAGYRISENGTDLGLEAEPEAVGGRLLARAHELAMAALTDYTKVHAGCAVLGGRRILAVGPGRSGKTTLMTKLLYSGFEVHGDEMVLLRDGVAVAYPRRFGIRQPTLSLVPQVEPLVPEWGRAPNSHGYQVFALNPGDAGFEWRIAPGVVDAIVYLEPRRGGDSHLLPCPQHLMAQRMMSQSEPPRAGRRQWIEDVCAVLGRAKCYTLEFGELNSAVAALRRALAAATG
jgi:hypothetical protein